MTGSREPIAATLNAIALRLVQLEPADRAGIDATLSALVDAAMGTDHAEIGDRLMAAVQHLTALLTGAATGTPEVELAAVNQEIEAAMRLAEVEAATAPSPDAASPSGSPVVPAGAPLAEEPVTTVVETSLPPDLDASMLSDFISESRDMVQSAEASLLALETDPSDSEAINTIFRAFHTLKGMAAFLNFKRVTELAHHSESFLSRIRSGELRYHSGFADLALASVDIMKELLQNIQDALGGGAIVEPEQYKAQIYRLTHVEAIFPPKGTPPSAPPEMKLGELLVQEGKADADEVEMAVASKGDLPIGVALVRADAASVTDVGQALRKQQAGRGAIRTDAAAETSVRVRTDRLDRLINLIGELVISQSMLDQDETAADGLHADLLNKIGQSGKVVAELQDLAMALRMVPLKPTFQKMTRLVRDLSQKGGKQVNLVTEGEDTEIDRNMVEVINELLVHMVRNSMDHGLEPPAERQEAGKDPTGLLRLSATQTGGNVVFEIVDDGRGLNRERIIAKAVQNKLIASAQGLSENEINNLIFEPGFSTAEKVTDISGRGVGMDVVKRGIESLRGSIDIESRLGQGCTFTLKVPLTMAITDGMVVRVSDQRFILPTMNIKMTMQPGRQDLATLEGRGEMLRFMDEMLPIHRLHRLFGITGAAEALTESLLAIVEHGSGRYALQVDELLGQAQVVAKSLGEGIGRVPGIAGGAILGDGRVGLLLDPAGLLELAESEVNQAGMEKVA